MLVVTDRQITCAHRTASAASCSGLQCIINEANGKSVTNPFLERQVSGRHFGPLNFRSWAAATFKRGYFWGYPEQPEISPGIPGVFCAISVPSRGQYKINKIIILYEFIDLISSHLIPPICF
jgi:hypothetical protein